jgi:hypothetical protein
VWVKAVALLGYQPPIKQSLKMVTATSIHIIACDNPPTPYALNTVGSLARYAKVQIASSVGTTPGIRIKILNLTEVRAK